MKKRQEAAEAVAKARAEKLRLAAEEAEKKERQERKAKSEANKQSMTMVTKNQLSWRELQEIEEGKRRDRIERRKQEMAQLSALPSSIAENLQKVKRDVAADSVPSDAVRAGEFKAEDPAKVRRTIWATFLLHFSFLNSTSSACLSFSLFLYVMQVAAKLSRQQKVWDMKMEREREKRNERRTTKMLAASAHLSATSNQSGQVDGASYLNKTAMEVRNEQYAAKREAKRRELKEK
jgi:hypothetical protein